MLKEEMDAIRARVEAASKGPWEVFRDKWPDGEEGDEHCTVCALAGDCSEDCPSEPHCHECVMGPVHYAADAEFIAHAITDIPRLLQALERSDKMFTWIESAAFDGISAIREAATAFEAIEAHRHAVTSGGDREAADQKLWAALDRLDKFD